MMVFIYIAIIGSLTVSNTKVRAEGLGIEWKKGFTGSPKICHLTGYWTFIEHVCLGTCHTGGPFQCDRSGMHYRLLA
ncbi:hypothetical protein KSZ_45320 [Dictyobacter formicarum]|uniref:Uncharacterized protein n=1 Tax=Dictyobacter formicarum TaxID=2778368 RepID=A0ABQ3VLJ0_9CHLR|nr:hypothetical protein KSZ_45320 [Dictyobacter formicarum]